MGSRSMAPNGPPVHRVVMDEIQRASTKPDRSNDCEPVARWENEGGACNERDAAVRQPDGVTAAQDGQAVAR